MLTYSVRLHFILVFLYAKDKNKCLINIRTFQLTVFATVAVVIYFFLKKSINSDIKQPSQAIIM